MKIPIEDCIHRGVYKINCRNLAVGVYNSVTKSFTGIREKFGDEFLFPEIHWDADKNFGTVSDMEFICMLPDEIEIETYVPSEECPGTVEIYKPLFSYLKGVEKDHIS